MLVATVLNLVLLMIFFIVGFVVLNLVINKFPSIDSAIPVLTILVFVVSIFGSFFVYSRIVKWATAKFNLEDKLDPLFTPKRNRRNKED